MQIHQKVNVRRFALASVFCALAFNAYANDSVELTDGVIVDLAKGRVYLMRPKPAVESISIDNGSVIWANENAAKPLALQENKLVSQAELVDTPNVLSLVVMDVENDGQVVSSSKVTLPSNVSAFIDEGLTGRFSSRGVTVDQEAFVSWGFQPIPRQGMVMGPAEEDQGRDAGPPRMPAPTTSTIRLDLQTGDVSEIEPQDLPPSAARAFTPPGRSAAPSDPTTKQSADGRHTLTYERVADDREWNKYVWTIVNNETGDEIGELQSHLSQSDFVVVDSDIIVFETGAYVRRTESGLIDEPRSIRAVNLGTGVELWSRPVRDPVFRGQLPP
ncbi:MAG: hypothetical protein IH867_10085 [Chloroflexi bacterium]|nr:hypothetical protein [Chloroflexota bacterium]